MLLRKVKDILNLRGEGTLSTAYYGAGAEAALAATALGFAVDGLVSSNTTEAIGSSLAGAALAAGGIALLFVDSMRPTEAGAVEPTLPLNPLQ